ncbi:MAG: membrane protein insertion efficiency factor YidD [Coxiella sp. RIFCSPHIGHO2_12_FULL_44_14]|nr:MAG: membrane protein insertion efficiency factor YidD [Coxiella sp. RIFCSPHIGHO2_12_FULL_44_14]
MLRRIAQPIERFIQKSLILLIRIYRVLLGSVLGGQCRFYPSCSHYMEQAIVIHGAIKGGLLGMGRIMRCNPFHPGGVDAVPKKINQKAQ